MIKIQLKLKFITRCTTKVTKLKFQIKYRLFIELVQLAAFCIAHCRLAIKIRSDKHKYSTSQHFCFCLHYYSVIYLQHEHFPDNVKFPDGSRHYLQSSTALGMLSVTHIMPILGLLSVVGQKCNSAWSETICVIFSTEQTPTKNLYGRKYAAYNKQFLRQLFHDKIFSQILVKSLTFPWRLSNSLTFPGFQTNGHPVFTYYNCYDKTEVSV